MRVHPVHSRRSPSRIAFMMSGLLTVAYSVCFTLPARADEQGPDPRLRQFAEKFFSWRQQQQPATADDIPRVERPPGWVPKFSAADLAIDRVKYREYLNQLAALDQSGYSRADQVDSMLLGSAIKRVGWELDVLRTPHRNPLFYLQQTLGSVFELLVLCSPMTTERLDGIILRLQSFPAVVDDAKTNLTEGVRPFAITAVENLLGIEDKLAALRDGLTPLAQPDRQTALAAAIDTASESLADYRVWLQRRFKDMNPEFSIGYGAYQWYLLNVALIPNTPEELLAQGRQAWNRAVALDELERNRNRDLPDLPVFRSSEEQVEAALHQEREIRSFLHNQDLVTVPDWLMHYRLRPMPAYLQPLAFMGVTDDLTSETRLQEDACSYIPEPSAELPYFQRSAAMDPRPLMAHEGIPGHYFQLALSWSNPDPIRRRYFDSGANEGIGFYVEEMLLQSGLFSFSPRSREIIYSFMRLRALRVEVDIRLATGEFGIEQAAEYLARTVPMDRETAVGEAVWFASNPGQAIGYQIGKIQIEEFLADAILDQKDKFSLRRFHDFLMQNGNVPIALQRWEYLGRDDGVKRLQDLSTGPATVPD